MATKSRSRLIRRIVYVLVGLVVIAFIVSHFVGQQPAQQYITAKVQSGDVEQTVQLTGTTEPKTRYQLQFAKSGKIAQILVQVGSEVKNGDVLAVLENNDLQDQLAAQKDILKVAQANLAKAVAPQVSENIKSSQLKVDLAKLSVDNASTTKQDFLSSEQQAENSAYLAEQSAKTALDQAQNEYNYTLETVQRSTWQQPDYQVYDSGYYYGDLRNSLPQSSSMTGGTTTMPGTSSAGIMASPAASSNGTGGYLSNVNSIDNAQYAVQKAQDAYDAAQTAYDKATADLKSQSDTLDNTVSQAQDNLQTAQQGYNLTVAKPRDVDVAPLAAQIDQAWDGVNLAQYQLDQTELKAPDDGIVTGVAFNPGETPAPGQPFITLDSKYLYIKVLVSEADIAKIQVGQNVDLTFDAFGTDKSFKGNVYEVDPSETIVQGVVYYVVKVQFDAQGQPVKPGMTANLTIQTNAKTNVLDVPARAVQYDANQAYVQVLTTDASGKQTVQKQNVTVGLQGDENYEITSGLQAGQDVVTFNKSS